MTLRAKKKSLWHVYCESNTQRDHTEFKQARNKLRKVTRGLRNNYEKQLLTNMKENPKCFWRYVNSRLKTRTGIADLMEDDGSMVSSNEDKARLLNSFFTSVFTIEDTDSVPVMEPRSFKEPLRDIPIGEDTVRTKLEKLLPAKSPGPDGWHPRWLKEIAEVIATPLSNLY